MDKICIREYLRYHLQEKVLLQFRGFLLTLQMYQKTVRSPLNAMHGIEFHEMVRPEYT